MVDFIVRSVEKKAKKDLESGKQMYRKYFINTSIYNAYKDDVDEKLTADGFESVIVTE